MILKVVMPYNFNCINTTIATGNLSNPAIWSKGVVPDVCDSVIVNASHTITIDTPVIIRSLRINAGGALVCNNSDSLQLGQGDEGFASLDNYGTLNVSNGAIVVNGRLRNNPGSSFNMTLGRIIIDGNKGNREMSLPNGASLFEAAAGMTSFNFSGGSLQINNPPYGSASQAINCTYDFGDNSTLILGMNAVTTASNNPDGFGGMSFPNKIGRLVVNAGTRSNNRQLIIKKPLTVKGNVDVKTGSGILLQAPLIINQ